MYHSVARYLDHGIQLPQDFGIPGLYDRRLKAEISLVAHVKLTFTSARQILNFFPTCVSMRLQDWRPQNDQIHVKNFTAFVLQVYTAVLRTVGVKALSINKQYRQ